MKVKVYDISAYIMQKTSGQFKLPYDTKRAIMLNEEGKGLIMDYESCGDRVTGLEQGLQFDVIPVVRPTPIAGAFIKLHATYTAEPTIRELIENAPFEEVDIAAEPEDGGFFWRGMKERRQSNYRDMMYELKKLGIYKE